MNTMKRPIIIALVLVMMLVLPISSAFAASGDYKAFTVDIIWVNSLKRVPGNLQYVYQFANAKTGEAYPLVITPSGQQSTGDDRIVKAEGKISLPSKNTDGSEAVYLLSANGSGYVLQDGISYSVSTSESQDPGAGTPYYNRYRVLSQQINPQVQINFEGIEPQPITLNLQMNSWALSAKNDGSRAAHQASVLVNEVPQAGLNLVDLFSANAEDIVLFRNFALAELAWDGEHIAGENHFVLSMEEIPGVHSEILGNAYEGYQINLKAAQ